MFHLDEKYSGQPRFGKIAKLREEMEKQKAEAIAAVMLDEAAWPFNLRGSDIDYNPGMYSIR